MNFIEGTLEHKNKAVNDLPLWERMKPCNRCQSWPNYHNRCKHCYPTRRLKEYQPSNFIGDYIIVYGSDVVGDFDFYDEELVFSEGNRDKVYNPRCMKQVRSAWLMKIEDIMKPLNQIHHIKIYNGEDSGCLTARTKAIAAAKEAIRTHQLENQLLAQRMK